MRHENCWPHPAAFSPAFSAQHKKHVPHIQLFIKTKTVHHIHLLNYVNSAHIVQVIEPTYRETAVPSDCIGIAQSKVRLSGLVPHQGLGHGDRKKERNKRRVTGRGENVVLLGETDLDQVSIEEILKEQRLQQQAKRETEKVKMQALKDGGLSIP
uniref:Uncharacterized protein n=1 Tax=Oryzias latipes TaxID=8090 RepID=A0A3B3I9N9_ORYLA